MNNTLFNNNLVVHRHFQPRRPRVYRHRPSQLQDTFTDEEIRNRYRFRRNSINFICNIVRQDLQRPTQVLASLRFLASVFFYQVDADVLGIDKSTVCRVLDRFCRALVAKKNDFIKFPFTDAKKDKNKEKFYKMGGFPSCILAVDGFHVRVSTLWMKMNL